jgi:Na+/proline symporter
LPHGISGLVIAAIFAAAMSNLSGSLNSLSSSTVIDFYKPLVNPQADDQSLLNLSRWFTVGWGVILILIAIVSKTFTKSVLNTALTIASLPYGAMLGAFLLGVLTKRANQKGVMTGMAVALGTMLFVWLKTPLAWTWYVLTGTIICSGVGYLVSLMTASSGTPALQLDEGSAVKATNE